MLAAKIDKEPFAEIKTKEKTLESGIIIQNQALLNTKKMKD